MKKHLKAKSSHTYFLIYMLFAASLFPMFVSLTLATDVTVKVDPPSITVYKNSLFSVNVTILNVTSLVGWEFKLYWSRTILNITQVEIHVPDVWYNSSYEAGLGLQSDFNSTHARFWKAMCLLNPAQPFTGSMALVTFTFKALKTGIATLDLQDALLAGAPKAIPIPDIEYDGTITVLPPPLYMRSDKHTINGATMNKLLETHTGTSNVTSIYATDPENEFVCYWGIRVWKRSVNGTETEITSGTPLATVSRTGSGLGIQSATWTPPNTSLNPTDALIVRVYYKFDYGSYTLAVQFITPQLNATTLTNQTWTVYYYTRRAYTPSTHRTTMYYYWDNDYGSRIENMNYN